jgi:hypothetical protein
MKTPVSPYASVDAKLLVRVAKKLRKELGFHYNVQQDPRPSFSYIFVTGGMTGERFILRDNEVIGLIRHCLVKNHGMLTVEYYRDLSPKIVIRAPSEMWHGDEELNVFISAFLAR